LAANQLELNAVAAWALPATINNAMAWANGLSRSIDSSPSRHGAFGFARGLQRSITTHPFDLQKVCNAVLSSGQRCL
jgi:hypothetical protein